ncbi:MAG: hypothetical protein Q4A05_09825, partial [Ruminococcus sp.]|nr:hypothetical protein [Ruminococcus sp.]
MKKLISAAASLAMAASMVSSAVPFVTGAADSSKGFELRTFLDVDGKEVSSTISADAISAGAVTVPVGLFLTEGTNDSQTLSAQFTVKSSDGDASNTYVTFKKHQAGSDYFKSAQSVSLKDGSSGSTKSLIGFAGKIVNDDEDGDYFSPTVTGQCFAEPKSDSANTPNAFGSIAMTGPTSGTYTWSGDKSDSYPVYVVDVIFAKDTPAGTYTIDFCDYAPDADYPDNMSNMIETAGGKMTTKNSKLTLKSLDITVGGTPSGTTATTTATPEATTTHAKTTQGGTTPLNYEVDEKFIVKPEDATVEAGGTVNINIMCENGSDRKAGQFIAQVIDENLPIEGATATMTSVRCSAVATKPEYKEINGTWYCDTLDSGEPQEIDTSKAVAKFAITVPADATPGVYEWKLDRFHVVENGYDAIEFDAVLATGKLEVTGGAGGTTTTEPDVTTTETEPTTTATEPT